MDFDAFNALPEEEKKPFQVECKCQCGEPLVSVDGHSIGALHAMCPICKMCPACEEGDV